jgi:hypothetical protein
LIWARADTLVWLDYSMGLCFRSVLARCVRRSLTREELWNGNRERLWVHLFTRDSLLLWVLTTHSKNRRRYTEAFQSPEWAHMRRVRLASRGAAEEWVAKIRSERARSEAEPPLAVK